MIRFELISQFETLLNLEARKPQYCISTRGILQESGFAVNNSPVTNSINIGLVFVMTNAR